jgi:hypothetical protein
MLPADFQLPAGVVLLVAGLIACLAGYRLFRAVLAIYGFLLGAFFASTLVAPSDTTAMLVALGVGGLLGALVLYAGYFVGVGLVGAGLGATVSHSVWLQWRGSDPGMLVVLFFAAVGAALAVTVQRVVVIAATAFLGSQTAVAGALAVLARQPVRRPGVEDVWIGHLGIPAYRQRWAFFAWVALGVAGTIVQLRSGGGRRARPRK